MSLVVRLEVDKCSEREIKIVKKSYQWKSVEWHARHGVRLHLTGRQTHRNTQKVTSSMIPSRISHNSQSQASSDTSYINLVVRIGVDKCGYGGE